MHNFRKTVPCFLLGVLAILLLGAPQFNNPDTAEPPLAPPLPPGPPYDNGIFCSYQAGAFFAQCLSGESNNLLMICWLAFTERGVPKDEDLASCVEAVLDIGQIRDTKLYNDCYIDAMLYELECRDKEDQALQPPVEQPPGAEGDGVDK